ncbi:TetR/AcrR family transcriptional regulator [Sphingosinicella microcystinivorans]|uniref:Transcriptional regulator n=1 Tax=Sphingosinicella microcystinivorans TaxID=335406 RepID=A0AAD1D650_SPHMI|nr:TetR/AcrR family transcriptional regulator [Sphingosinicella microcystinivorans]RKS91131.1 TetR family transcriptional regulator [Sphingosinicella microcystinivorans]BBE34052.1 transcriptional regulator [Sphingosinicella microcystinivorans]
MTESAGNVTRLMPHGEDAVDGRRLRSERSRAQIVAAMRAVIEGGDMDPNVTSVARAAGVSIRTVFRHFEELDSLYRELNAQIEAEILPMVMTQFEARDWQGRACEVVTRRARIYERLMLFKSAAHARRFQSEYLMDAHRRFLIMERAALQAILPAEIQSNKALFAALEMVTGFQSWQRLRHDQNLAPEDAEAAVRLAVERLLGL